MQEAGNSHLAHDVAKCPESHLICVMLVWGLFLRIVNEAKFLLNTREHMNFESRGKTQHLVKNMTFIDDSDKYEGYSESNLRVF
jgi:hypothetical protein